MCVCQGVAAPDASELISGRTEQMLCLGEDQSDRTLRFETFQLVTLRICLLFFAMVLSYGL